MEISVDIFMLILGLKGLRLNFVCTSDYEL